MRQHRIKASTIRVDAIGVVLQSGCEPSWTQLIFATCSDITMQVSASEQEHHLECHENGQNSNDQPKKARTAGLVRAGILVETVEVRVRRP